MPVSELKQILSPFVSVCALLAAVVPRVGPFVQSEDEHT